MRTEQDPFKLARGGFTNISGELVIMVSMVAHGVPVSVVIEITQSGTLTVEDILSTGSEPRRRCAINSNGMINTQNKMAEKLRLRLCRSNWLSSSISPVKMMAVRGLPLNLICRNFSAFDAWDTDALDIDIGFQFTRSWSSAEEAVLQGFVTYLLRYATGNQTHQVTGSLPLFSGGQRINPDVLKPDNLLHDTSLTALREIGNGLNDSQFADIHARQLFHHQSQYPKSCWFMAGGIGSSSIVAERNHAVMTKCRRLQLNHCVTGSTTSIAFNQKMILKYCVKGCSKMMVQ